MSTITMPHAPTVRVSMAPRRRQPAVRLTIRGRVVVLLVGLALALALAFVLGSGSAATERPGADSTRVVTVGAGQTLWQIAAETSPDRDVRETVRTIMRLNGLETAAVQAGQRIRVPR